MRAAPLAFVVTLTACAADPVLLPDAGPCSGSCGAGTVCQGGACVPVDAGGADAGTADVGSAEDRPPAMDVPVAVDLGAVDAGGMDAGADSGPADSGPADTVVDVRPADVGICPNGRTAVCDGRNVDLVNGERDGGMGQTFFCGGCSGPGTVCAADEGCLACRCQR